MNYSVNLDITPGGMPPVLHMSQYDTDRQYTVNLKDGGSSYSLGTGATGKVKGFNGKACFEIEATASGSTVTFQLTDASTDQFGIFPVTLELTNDGETISPLCMIFDVQRAGYTNEQAANSPEFENAMEEAAQKYVLGMDLTARTALLDLLSHVAYIDQNGQDYYDALELALRAKLSYIVADYAQDHTVYDSDSLDSLKAGDELIVTAYYDDGSHIDLSDSQYTLSGTLTAGTSTITVSYNGKTTTFNVTVTTTRLYTLSNHVFNGTGDYVDTGVDLLSTDKNFTIAVDVDMTASLQSKSITNWSITSCIYGSSPYDGLELKAYNQSPYKASMQYMNQWLTGNDLISDFDQTTTGRARFLITHANGSGSIKLQAKVGANTIKTRTITASFSAKQRLNVRVGGNATSQFFAGTMTNYIIDSVVWSDAKIAEFFE